MTPGIPAERLSLVAGAGRGDSLIRQAFDLAAAGLAVLDVSRPLARIVLANTSFGSLLGVPATDLAGDPLQSWIHRTSAALAQAALEAARAGGPATRIELGLV